MDIAAADRRRCPTRGVLILAVVAGLMVTALPLSGATTITGPGPTGLARNLPMSAPHPVAPVSAALPGGGLNVTLGTTYSSIDLAPANSTDTPCLTNNYGFVIQSTCYPQTQNPSIVRLATGHFGVGYSLYTTVGPLCNASGNSTNLTSWTATTVAWAQSLSNASVWGAPTLLGSPSCRWPSASEPTFAAGIAGVVDGAYILSNQTINSSGTLGSQPYFPPDWNAPVGDALAFVQSGNGGTTWSNVSVVPNVTAAVRPQMAVFGNTIYIAYVRTDNSTASYPGGNGLGPFPALAVELVVSNDSGATWGAPVVLPGWNATMANWSSAPSVAVNQTGALAVAYATNRSCLLSCRVALSPYSTYGEQIVVATSTGNGTTWTGPTVAGNWTGESYAYPDYSDAYYSGYSYPWMATPQTAIAYDASGHGLFVAYSGTFYKSAAPAYADWQDTGVFAAHSTNGGATWTNATVAADFAAGNADNYYSPAVAVAGGTAYIAYVWLNETYCYSSSGCPDFVGTVSSWVASSANGVAWVANLTAVATYLTPSYIANDYQGWESSIAISAGGTPVTATTLPSESTSSFSSTGPPFLYSSEYYTNVSIASVYTGPTAVVTFDEHNLTAGSVWGIAFDGLNLTTNQSSIRISEVPLHVAIPVGLLPLSVSIYRAIFTDSLSIPSPYEFVGPKVADANFTIEYGLQFWVQPTLTTNVEQIRAFIGGQFYFVECFNGATYSGPSFPWYFPAGVTETFQGGSDPPITYWNGSGVGSYTGGGTEINVTMGGPVNETGWAGSYGVYTEGFQATGLPPTSRYSFAFAGTNYSSPSSNWTYVPGIATGGYTVSGITANSSTPGWEYFGAVASGSDTVVVPAEPTVRFDFAFVDVAAPSGTVTFYAPGLGFGTVWSVDFNGTAYSTSTPWLNVTTRPGTFPWSPGAAVAANGSAGFTPVAVGPTLSVVVGQTVNLSYTPAYRVDVIAGLGGFASGFGSHWFAAGSAASFNATPGGADSFGGWTGTGAGSYTGPNLTASLTVGGPITETASFFPLPASRFNVTFDEAGIPSGSWWTVDLNGVGYSSNSTSLTVSNLLSCAAGTAGQYFVSVGVAYNTTIGSTRYDAVNPPIQFCTNGGTIEPLTFAPQYLVSLSTTLGGSAYVSDRAAISAHSLWANASDNVQLSESSSFGEVFVGWTGTGTGSYTGTAPTAMLSIGGPVTELATFVPVLPVHHPTYSVEFTWAGSYVAGSNWGLTVNGTGYSAVGRDINVSGLAPNTYQVAVGVATSADDLTRWSPTLATFSLPVTQNTSKSVVFAPPSYWVAIGGSAGGSESPLSGWYPSGVPLHLVAVPDFGEVFATWTGNGSGSYSGNQSTVNATVGAPLTEFATFHPTVSGTTTATSFWSNISTWAALGGVGLLAGLVVGYLVFRLRRAPSGPRGSSTSGGEDR